MITSVRAIVPTSVRKAVPLGTASATEEHVTSTALTPVVRVESSGYLHLFSQRPAAPFLAQLIATSQSAPQTRTRNRATPREAIAAYGNTKRMLKRRAA